MITKNDFTIDDLMRYRAVNIKTGMIQFFISGISLQNYTKENPDWIAK